MDGLGEPIVWGTLFLPLKNAVSVIPWVVWIILGAWIYLNLGWRFAEYKLGLEKRWRTIHPVWLSLIFPAKTATALHESGETAWWISVWDAGLTYKIWSAFFLGPTLCWNAFVIIIL